MSIDDTTTPTFPAPAPRTVARLFAALWDGAGVGELAQYRTIHARPAPARPGRPTERILAAVDASGLRGRGGAGFPTGRKLRAVAGGRSRPIVVVNATEGEPISHKDHLLATRAPHLLLDGAAVAAAAVGASSIMVCIDRVDSLAIDAVRSAVSERERLEPGNTPVEVFGTPPRYVAGEESALVQWLNGGDARPTSKDRRPFEQGVAGRPTLISNAETICHLALIDEMGPAWFRQQGTEDEPGTCLVTVTGAVANPRVIEAGLGSLMADAIQTAGGATSGIGGVLVGGYFGAWIPASAIGSVTISKNGLAPYGASVGCGAIHVLPAHGCGVLETARVLGWYAGETANQCGPCVNGLAAIAEGAFERLGPSATRPTQLERWASEIERRGACALPDGAARFLRSALAVFGEHYEAHRVGIPCDAARRPGLLPIPAQPGQVSWR